MLRQKLCVSRFGTYKAYVPSASLTDRGDSWQHRPFPHDVAYGRAIAVHPAEGATGGKSVEKLSLHEALEFGIKTERDSINYYERIKSIAPQKDQSSVERILQKERKYYDKLIELKNKGNSN